MKMELLSMSVDIFVKDTSIFSSYDISNSDFSIQSF